MVSKQYGLIRTIQVRNENVPGVLGALATAIGQAEANGDAAGVSVDDEHGPVVGVEQDGVRRFRSDPLKV